MASEAVANSTGHMGMPSLPDDKPSSSLGVGVNGQKQKSRLENILFKLKRPDAEEDSAPASSCPASPEQSSNNASVETSNGKDFASVPAGSRSALDSMITVPNRRASRKPTRREQVFDDHNLDTLEGNPIQHEREFEGDVVETGQMQNQDPHRELDQRERDWPCTFNGNPITADGPQLRKNARKSFSCEKCDEKYSSLHELDMHSDTHTKKESKDLSIFPCYICGKSFASKSYLAQHVMVHNIEAEESDDQDGGFWDEIASAEGPATISVRCNLCQRRFRTHDALQLHKCKKGLVKPYGCGQCGRCFTHVSNLTSHQALHKKGIAPEMTCHQCGQRFMYSIELRRHADIHIKADAMPVPLSKGGAKSSSTVTSLNDTELETSVSVDGVAASGGDPNSSPKDAVPVSRFMPKKRSHKRGPPKAHPCHVCGKVFYQRGYLTMHMRVHGEKQYECSYCGKKFSFKKSLEIHVRSHTGEKPYSCQYCKKKFSRLDSLQKHERLHLGVKPFVCETCGRQFGDKFELYRHSLSHTKEKPHKCTQCNKAYNDKKRLKEHMFIHSGNLPYVCEVCGKGYARRYRYSQHVSQHAGEVRFNCEICSKGFYRRSDLNSHMETHSGKKPFACEVCGAGFLREGYLRRHMIVHSTEKPHHCSVCGKDFARKNTLRRHLLIHKRRDESLEDEMADVNQRFSNYSNYSASNYTASNYAASNYTANFGYGISGAVAPYAVSHAEERDIMKDIQAAIGLDGDPNMFV